eukprot:COSAG02_NODE_66744_length_254_cov_1.329032_1_plen_60_part_10
MFLPLKMVLFRTRHSEGSSLSDKKPALASLVTEIGCTLVHVRRLATRYDACSHLLGHDRC